MRDDSLTEFGAVLHGQVGAFTVRRHEVGGVAEQGDPRRTIPAVPDRQCEEAAQDRRGIAVGDQGGELRGPAVEFLGKI